MKFLKLNFLLIIILVFASCKNDDDTFITPQNQNPDPTAFAENYFGSEITRTFLGTVVDTNNDPIENVNISIGNSTAMTDSNGVFIISDATVNQRFGYVKAEKAGFIHASRAVAPSEGTNKVRIMMLPETVAGSTSSGTQETIAIGNGASVALEGDYIKPDGSAYSGNVNVIMHHLDPADENMQDQMPGMLYAANAQNEERMLQTFGMLAIELRGDNGEDLNLAEGSTAEITVPLDASLIATAPSTIPLWYFDEAQGYWIEDGEATLDGNTYVGTVSHFSFWTCSIFPIDHSILEIHIIDENQMPLENIKVSLESDGLALVSSYTNGNGIVSGLIPSNQTIDINIFSGFVCLGNSIYYETIGPFSSNAVITITIPDNTISITEELSGSFNNCSGTSIDNGYVFIAHSGKIFTSIIQSGNFNTNILRCTDNDLFSIEVIDFDTLNTTSEINIAFNTPYTYLGDLSSCNEIEEFVSFKIGEHVAFIPYANDINIDFHSDMNFLTFNTFGLTDYGFAFGGFITNVPNGEFPLNNGTSASFVIEGFNDTYNAGEFYMSSAPYDLESYITVFGNVGEFVDIIFIGTYTAPDDTVYPLNALIHARLDQIN